MIGEIVPLLTAPGQLENKLRMVAHRLSAGAGYDAVRFRIDDQSGNPHARPMFLIVPTPETSSPDTAFTETGDRIREALERTHRPIIISDLLDDEHVAPSERELFRNANLRSSVVVPMIWHGTIVGVLSVASTRVGALDARDAQFVATVADQVTAIIRMETLVDDLQVAAGHLEDARTDTMVLLAAAAEAHEQSTGAHLHRVQALSERLARELGYDERLRRRCRPRRDPARHRQDPRAGAHPPEPVSPRWLRVGNHETAHRMGCRVPCAAAGLRDGGRGRAPATTNAGTAAATREG